VTFFALAYLLVMLGMSVGTFLTFRRVVARLRSHHNGEFLRESPKALAQFIGPFLLSNNGIPKGNDAVLDKHLGRLHALQWILVGLLMGGYLFAVFLEFHAA
jgi:hypothetical protein